MENSIMGPANQFMSANAPADLDQLRQVFAGLPLGVTTTGELGLKVIVIGNASASLATIPQADPHVAGLIWNNGGVPTISNG